MKIITRNVNGIRAVAKKGFTDRLASEAPDVLCIQETKAFAHQLGDDLLAPHGYRVVRHTGTRPGYAGTAIYTREDVTESVNIFPGYPIFSDDGRVTQVTINGYTIVNVYFPNGGTRADGTEMLTYKLDFYDQMIAYLNDLREQGHRIILTGDLNICHTEIDIARPDANKDTIGFKPIERDKISELLSHDYVDVFRHFSPEMTDEYTRWSYRAGARTRNVGRRIDYFVVDRAIIDDVASFRHRQDVMGSDHCPVEIVIK